MAVLQIPTRSDIDNYDFIVDLGGLTYTFEISWNTRNSQWNLLIKDDTDVVLIGAIPLVTNSDLLSRFNIAELPQGTLSLIDTMDLWAEAEKTDLGTRHQLIYEEAT